MSHGTHYDNHNLKFVSVWNEGVLSTLARELHKQARGIRCPRLKKRSQGDLLNDKDIQNLNPKRLSAGRSH